MVIKAVWLSIDPVRRKVDFYPKTIALRIQKAYNERNLFMPTECVLGKDFFNSTIHFHPTGGIYQTTPGFSMGRAGFKQPGYRSVKQYILKNEEQRVIVLSKQIHGEWRIAANDLDAEIRFDEKIPPECLIEITDQELQIESLNIWKPEDLECMHLDKNVISWQWCRGVPENQGDLIKLSDNWWVPYNYQNNEIIENAFKNGEYNVNNVDIELPVIGERTIEFIRDTCYAKQISKDNTKVRIVRRVITTIQIVKCMFDRISNPPIDIDTIIAELPDGSVPHHFNCPILQDIMKNPVKTVDGHIYDYSAIQRWFMHNTTSPLTGLKLISTVLEPQNELKNQIESFLRSLINKKNSENPSVVFINNEDNNEDDNEDDKQLNTELVNVSDN